MFEDGLSYPFEGDEAVKNLLIGGILNFFSFLILPIFVILGYYIAVIRTTVQGYDQPPLFQDWGTLITDGLKATAIGIVYSIVPLLIFFVLFAVLGAAGGESDSGIVAGLGVVFFLLLFLVYAVIMYLVPAALANFAVEGGLGSGFDFDTITSVITHGAYIKAFLMAIGVGLIIGIVATILQITIIGIILIPWVQFYAGVAIYRIYGTAYGEATQGGGPAGGAAGHGARPTEGH